MKKLFTFLAFIILLASFASAGNLYTINLVDQNSNPLEGDAYVYVCTDITCDTIDTSYTPVKLSSTNSKIVYEGLELSTEKHYGVFLYSDGYLGYKIPIYNDKGTDLVRETTADFSKINICQAPIISLSSFNDVNEKDPIQINISARLNSTVASAFRVTDKPPSFEPYEARGEKVNDWSANTVITVNITDGNGITHTIIDSANIFADETEEFTFPWMPTAEGLTTIEVTAVVDDEQCMTSETTDDQTTFTVLKDLSGSSYHTLILDTSAPAHPKANEEFNITFDVISYFLDNATKAFTDSNITYTITDNSNLVVEQGAFIVIDNQSDFSQVTIPTTLPAGEYFARIQGTADNTTYDVYRNDADITVNIFVEPQRYELTITAIDALTNNGIDEAKVTINEYTQHTIYDGSVTFEETITGNKYIEISKDGFIPETDTISLTSDMSRTYTLQRTTCNDGIDNDNDGFIDLSDPECNTINDFEGNIYNVNDYDFTLTVLDSSTNNTIAGVYVEIGTKNVITNNNGIISIEDIVAGNYTYVASLFGYNTARGTYEITEDTNEILYLDPVNIVEKYDFNITILDANTRKPIVGATVEISNSDFTTDNNGMISFIDLLKGNYTFEATANGYQSNSGVFEVVQDTNEIVYLVPENVQIQYDLFSVPIVETYNTSEEVIICQNNFAVGYSSAITAFVDILINNVQHNYDQYQLFGNPERECINFGLLQNGTYTVEQIIDPYSQYADDNRSNNLLTYTFIVGKSDNGGNDPEVEEKEIPRIGITTFDFFAIDYSKASELDQIQIGLTNDGDFKMKDVVITLSIPELAVWDRVRIDELHVGETEYDYLRLGVYDTYEPGYYDLRVSVTTNSGYSRARWFEVYLE